MLDIIIFLISPENAVIMLPVILMPDNPSFSLCCENERLDFSLFRNLHDDSSIDGISIGEGVVAVDGVIFNREIQDGHRPQRNTRWKSLVKSKKKLQPCGPCSAAIYPTSGVQILWSWFFWCAPAAPQSDWRQLSVLHNSVTKQMQRRRLQSNWMVTVKATFCLC